jgi:hypothetical protein
MTTTLQHKPVTGRRDDRECQINATEFLTGLLGAAPDDLRWDDDHHLQGHAHSAGHEIVVIAPRDNAHHTLVFTPEDWDAIRHSATCDRDVMLRTCAIESHARLAELLAHT